MDIFYELVCVFFLFSSLDFITSPVRHHYGELKKLKKWSFFFLFFLFFYFFFNYHA